MRIGIIGAGKMGGTLAKLWAAKGHAIMLGSRDPNKARTEAASIGDNVSGGSNDEAAAFGDVVLIGVPWKAAVETVTSIAASLAGKTVIDITNPVGEGTNLAVGHTTSAAEEIAKAASGAQVVKAFNGIHFRTLDNPIFEGHKVDVYYCGDYAEAKQKVAQLIVDAGFEPVDTGALQEARLLEPLAMLWIRLAFVHGWGPDFAFKILKR